MVVRLILATFVMVAACSVGEVPIEGGETPDGGGDPAAEASFNAQVMPLITAKGCLVGGTCHAPPSLQQPTLTAFSDLQARFKVKPSASNPLITKEGTLGAPDANGNKIHQGVIYFGGADLTTVANWIDSL